MGEYSYFNDCELRVVIGEREAELDHLRAEMAKLQQFTKGCVASGGELVGENQKIRTDLTALQTEFESVRAERVQLETLCASRADEIHRLNNELTSVTLERDAFKRALNTIASMPDEANEWQGAEYFITARRCASEALS